MVCWTISHTRFIHSTCLAGGWTFPRKWHYNRPSQVHTQRFTRTQPEPQTHRQGRRGQFQPLSSTLTKLLTIAWAIATSPRGRPLTSSQRRGRNQLRRPVSQFRCWPCLTVEASSSAVAGNGRTWEDAPIPISQHRHIARMIAPCFPSARPPHQRPSTTNQDQCRSMRARGWSWVEGNGMGGRR